MYSPRQSANRTAGHRVPASGPVPAGAASTEDLTLLGFDQLTLVWIAAASLAAFIVRGLSGFGSSLIGIGALSMVLPPAYVVPAFLALEVVTTVNLLPGIWHRIDWRSLRWVVAGSALATPFGVMMLAFLDADRMRLLVSACVAAIALLMLSGVAQRFAPRSTPGPLGTFVVGIASGALNGAAGIGGPPVVVFYFATTGAATSRATLIAFFLVTDIYALAWAGGTGVLSSSGWQLIAVALPFSLAGIWIGHRLYLSLDENRLRRLIWALLAVLGTSGLASAGWRIVNA